MIVRLLATVNLFIFISSVKASATFLFSGYVTEVNTPMYNDVTKQWGDDNLIHNRLNFDYRPNQYWQIYLGMRNRFMCGTSYTQEARDAIGKDAQGIMPLSFNWLSGNKYLLNTTIDRLYVGFEIKQWNVRLGRQRINWSQCLIWNPNDLFNGYSFFDLDYTERQGTDALRLTYYSNETNFIELVTNINYQERWSAAAKYQFNVNLFDIQVLAGMSQEQDITLGTGFSGDVKGVNLRGEATYFQPFVSQVNGLTTKPVVIATVGADYIFPNTLSLGGQIMWNSNAGNETLSSLQNVLSVPYTPKQLSPAAWSAALQASYTLTPLCSVSLSSIYFIDLNSIYLIPSVQYSLMENLSFNFSMQYYHFNVDSAMNVVMFYARLAYNF